MPRLSFRFKLLFAMMLVVGAVSGVTLYLTQMRVQAAYEKLFKANRKAWEFFRAQPPGYQKLATFWITGAKKEETQRKRLQIMIDASAKGTRTRWM